MNRTVDSSHRSHTGDWNLQIDASEKAIHSGPLNAKFNFKTNSIAYYKSLKRNGACKPEQSFADCVSFLNHDRINNANCAMSRKIEL